MCVCLNLLRAAEVTSHNTLCLTHTLSPRLMSMASMTGKHTHRFTGVCGGVIPSQHRCAWENRSPGAAGLLWMVSSFIFPLILQNAPWETSVWLCSSVSPASLSLPRLRIFPEQQLLVRPTQTFPHIENYWFLSASSLSPSPLLVCLF